MNLCCKIMEADKIWVKRQPFVKTSVIQRNAINTRPDGQKGHHQCRQAHDKEGDQPEGIKTQNKNQVYQRAALDRG